LSPRSIALKRTSRPGPISAGWLVASCPIAPPTPATYTLSLHDALPIYVYVDKPIAYHYQDTEALADLSFRKKRILMTGFNRRYRSEEHTSELQSREKLVCRLLLEKKKTR